MPHVIAVQAGAFIVAAAAGAVTEVEAAVQNGVDIAACDTSGRTALHWAAANRHVDVLRLLIRSHGVNAALLDSDGLSACHLAACVGRGATASREVLDSADALAALLDVDAALVSGVSQDGYTLLHLACRDGLLNVVKYLTARDDVCIDARLPTAAPAQPMTCIPDGGSSSVSTVVIGDEGVDAFGLTVEPALLVPHLVVVNPRGIRVVASDDGVPSSPAPSTRTLAHMLRTSVAFDRQWTFRPCSVEAATSSGGANVACVAPSRPVRSIADDARQLSRDAVAVQPPVRSSGVGRVRRAVSFPVPSPLTLRAVSARGAATASVEVCWTWIGKPTCGMQSFLVFATPDARGAQTVPWNPRQVRYSTTLHNLAYDMEYTFTVRCCVSARVPMPHSSPQTSVTFKAVSPLALWIEEAQIGDTDAALSGLNAVLSKSDVGGGPGMPREAFVVVLRELDILGLELSAASKTKLTALLSAEQAKFKAFVGIDAAEDSGDASTHTTLSFPPALVRRPVVPFVAWRLLTPVVSAVTTDAVRPAPSLRRMQLRGVSVAVVYTANMLGEWAVEPPTFAALRGSSCIPRLYGWTIDDRDARAVVQQYLPDGSLAHVLRQRGATLSLRWRHRVANQLLLALRDVARRGVVHGALQPRHVLLEAADNDGAVSVRIVGFDGIAHPLQHSHLFDAPEVLARGGTAGPASDVWSAAMLIWYVFSDASELPLQHLAALSRDDLRQRLTSDDAARPSRTALCPSALYNHVLSPCWHAVARCRPMWDALIDAMPAVEHCERCVAWDSRVSV